MDKYKFDGSRKFKIKDFDCADTGEFKERHEAVREFVNNLELINEYQQKIFAEKKEGIIFAFQAMDAAGKDGAVRAVLSCLSPQGVSEHSFKKPSAEENAHDYLWRFWKALPEKGNISIFNRSHYEDVLVQKVHKFYLGGKYADRIDKAKIIQQRYKQINNFEQYLWENSFRVIKIFLNVSKDEQARRFVSRVDTPKKNWKFSSSDIEERAYWDDYMEAFESCINNTAKPHTPWYVVPADHKWYARLIISRIILSELQNMNPDWPVLEEEEMDKLESYKAKLVLETGMDNLVADSNSKGFKVKPADTAIYQAVNADYKALKKKNIDKKIKEYAFEMFKNNYGVSEEHLEALGSIYLNYEEMEIAAEIENAGFINTAYTNVKKDIKKHLHGAGKEGRKLINQFKKEAKILGEQYGDGVNRCYGDYSDVLNEVVSTYEKNVAESEMSPEDAVSSYEDDVKAAYNNHRANTGELVRQTTRELAELHTKYVGLAEDFRNTQKKIEEALEVDLEDDDDDEIISMGSKGEQEVKEIEAEELEECKKEDSDDK